MEEVTPLLDEMLAQVDFSRINNGCVEIIPVLYALQVEQQSNPQVRRNKARPFPHESMGVVVGIVGARTQSA